MIGTVIKLTLSLMNIDDCIHFTLREWTRMSLAPTLAETERAKSQLKASLLLGLDGTTAIAEDVSHSPHQTCYNRRTS